MIRMLTKTCIYVGVSNITNTIYSLRFGFCKYPFWLISTTFYKFSRQRFFLLSCVSEWISNKIKLQIIFVQISRDMWKITIWSNQQWLWLSIPHLYETHGPDWRVSQTDGQIIWTSDAKNKNKEYVISKKHFPHALLLIHFQ